MTLDPDTAPQAIAPENRQPFAQTIAAGEPFNARASKGPARPCGLLDPGRQFRQSTTLFYTSSNPAERYDVQRRLAHARTACTLTTGPAVL